MPTPPNSRARAALNSWAFVLVFFLAALAGLRQWNSPTPWSHLDMFSGSYLLLSLFWAALGFRFHNAIARSKEVMGEAAGLSYDPAMFRWATILSVGELTVFLDYAHWHLVPALERPALQWFGLFLTALGALWLAWTDHYLVPSFSGEIAARRIMQQGPYRFVRHPRYAALLLSRIAFALTMTSILAWIFVLAWFIVIFRRMRLEEAHLREIFGAAYDTYARRTPRLLPSIF